MRIAAAETNIRHRILIRAGLKIDPEGVEMDARDVPRHTLYCSETSLSLAEIHDDDLVAETFVFRAISSSTTRFIDSAASRYALSRFDQVVIAFPFLGTA